MRPTKMNEVLKKAKNNGDVVVSPSILLFPGGKDFSAMGFLASIFSLV